MRVISGKRKGQPLKAVPGTSTRPTTDKVKESIFNMIGPYFHGGTALDLYGGSGSLGIEALSRGIEKVVFIDQNRKAVETIKENLEICDFLGQAEIYRNDAKRALKALKKREVTFLLIFLDPPYAKEELVSDLIMIAEHQLLASEGTIVCEHTADVKLPDKVSTLTCVERKTYGDTTITIFQSEK